MNKIDQGHITRLIQSSQKEVATLFGKTTVVSLRLPSGFVIVESSSCVDPENYDAALGEALALKRIENRLWELEGYKLQCALAI